MGMRDHPPQALDVARAWKGAEMAGNVEAAMETAAEVWTVHAKMARNRERTAVRDHELDEGRREGGGPGLAGAAGGMELLRLRERDMGEERCMHWACARDWARWYS